MKKYFLVLTTTLLLVSCSSDDGNPQPVEVEQETTEPEFIFSAPCENGLAGIYPCQDYGLIAHLPIDTFGAPRGNDCWGWTDPQSGKEYALMGLNNGTAFIDISDPSAPIHLGNLPTATVPSSWRDIKVYNNYAFIVSEAKDHGMQVFDLTRLRNASTSTPSVFTSDAIYTEFGNAHNIVINENSGFAYAVGTETFNGGPHFVNIQDPLNPIAAGGYEMADYSHDAQVVTYQGPDTEHVGKEILIGSNENEVVIVDISVKDAPVELSRISYDQTGYTHQGWFTENQQYFLLGDELDEINFGFNARTVVLDFTDLDSPILHTDYFGTTTAVDHNGYVKDNTFFLANYTAGLRTIDISGIGSKNLIENGFFDTYPEDDTASFRGVWSVYPYFQSGVIIISDIRNGLFIVGKSE